jgi:hypothetical protein
MAKDHSALISDIAAKLMDYSEDAAVLSLLSYSVGRVLLKEFKKLGQPASFDPNQHEMIRHVADWLTVAVANNEPWLARVDGQNRPLKLMKFPSIEAAALEADKAMLKAAQKRLGVKLVPGDEELRSELAEGYYLVRLLTPAALDAESALMQHCIGNGAYDASLDNDDIAFYSLRDPAGKPHATLEVRANWIIQLQGKQNILPDSKYLRLLLPEILSQRWQTYIEPAKFGAIKDKQDILHDLNDLPDTLEVPNDLTLTGSATTRLPSKLIVHGNLHLNGSCVDHLPDGLIVHGGVMASRSLLASIGRGVKIGRYLDVSSTPLEALPDDIVVKGSLTADNSRLRSFPPTAKIGEGIYLEGTPIDQLPEGMKVEGPLVLTGCANLRALPERLEVWGDLVIEETEITTIHPGVTVGGRLDAKGSKLADLTSHRLFASLDLSGTPMKSLPDNLSIWRKRGNGYLKLAGSMVEHIGAGTSVAGLLDMRKSRISRLPADLKVKGELLCNGSSLREIPVNFTVDGTFNISGTDVSVLPDNLKVKGDLIAKRLKGLSINPGLRASSLDIGGSTINSWVGPCDCFSIDCTNATIDEMPETLSLGGSLSANQATISKWPKRLKVDMNFSFEDGRSGAMPAHLSVGENAKLGNSCGTIAPIKMVVGRVAEFANAKFDKFPEAFHAWRADFSRSNITIVPATWRILGDLVMTGSNLATIENGVPVGGEFTFENTPLSRRLEIEEYERQQTTRSVRFSR